MEKSRSNIFADEDKLDLTGLTGARKPAPPAPHVGEIRAVAEAASFSSREPKRQQHRYTTGRNRPKVFQLDQRTDERFTALYDSLNSKRRTTFCEVLEYLLDAHDAQNKV